MAFGVVPEFIVKQVAGAVRNYIEEQREKYRAMAEPLHEEDKDALRPYYDASLDGIVLALVDQPPENPKFYAQVAAFGFKDLPDFSAMAGITFVDTIVAVRAGYSHSLLFHEMVHVEQYKAMGADGFARAYVDGFLRGGSYDAIPLEQHAYELEGRFTSDPGQVFSVSEEVKARVAGAKY